MTDQMIVNMLLDRLVEQLTIELRKNVQPTDLSYADVIKKGLLQTSKTQKNVQLGVSGGDHEDPDYIDSIVTGRGLQEQAGVKLPFAREVGGGQIWFRRGVVRLEIFLIRERLEENEAHEIAYEILGRAMGAIENTDLSDLIDDFGERAVELFCVSNTFFESGGPPKSFIFRGKIFWTCLTERP